MSVLCSVVICNMHMTASPRIFCVVLWSAAMLTKSPQLPLKGHRNGCIGRFFASKSWVFLTKYIEAVNLWKTNMYMMYVYMHV